MGLFSKWRARRKERRAQRQANRVERMQVRNERITLRGNKKNTFGSAISDIAKNVIPAFSGSPEDNSAVTGSPRSTVIVEEGTQQQMMKYLPIAVIGVVAYMLFKKSR